VDLILLGAPGAGKGTQSSLLAERLGMAKIATGDILRDAVRRGTELGLEAKAFMDAGELVPDAVIFGLVKSALAAPAAEAGAIFDGFPRNVVEVETSQFEGCLCQEALHPPDDLAGAPVIPHDIANDLVQFRDVGAWRFQD